MITKLDRESILVTIMGIMILFGLFYYGNQYLVTPIREEAEFLTETVESQETLLAVYPPEEELLEEVESNYAVTEAYLPNGVKANEALVTLERLANQENVEITSVSRVSANQAIEEVPANFLKNTYTAQVTSESPDALRNLVNRLMEEERVWNITSFSYDKAGEDTYSGVFTYELAFYSDNPVSEEEGIDEVEDSFDEFEE